MNIQYYLVSCIKQVNSRATCRSLKKWLQEGIFGRKFSKMDKYYFCYFKENYNIILLRKFITLSVAHSFIRVYAEGIRI